MTDKLLTDAELELMAVLWRQGPSTAREVLGHLPEGRAYTTVSTILRILVDKGHLTQRLVGREMVYKPTKPRKRAGQSALRRVVDTFFDGSLENAVAAHLADTDSDLSDEDLKRLAALIREARKKGR